MRMLFLSLAVVLGCTATSAVAEEVGIGSAVPKLEVKEFVKGDAVKDFAKGKVYVVEFWATWCGPCIQSIPHVSDLQKKYKDVTFVGVSVWEQDQEKVKPFVEKMGDKMSYRVAMDTEAGNNGSMAKNWMTAAGQGGIPAAFIINGEGKVAWIGHPMQMDKPLADIVAGKYDLAAAATEYKERNASKAKMAALNQKYAAAMRTGDKNAAIKVLDDAITEDPKLEKMLARAKFNLLQQAGDADKAMSYGQHLVEKVHKDDAQQLNDLAWTLVDPKKGTKVDAKLAKLALQAAQRADELSEQKDGAIADTLAVAQFAAGDAAKALRTQERAVKLATEKGGQVDPELKERLELYRKAVGKQ